MTFDPYEILGIDRNATPDEIKAAWRCKSSELHPDREGGDGEAMAEVNQAYEILSNPEARLKFDDFGPDADPIEVQAHALVEAVLRGTLASPTPDPIQLAKIQVRDSIEMMRQQIIANRALIERAQSARPFLCYTGPRSNLAHRLIDENVRSNEANIARCEEQIQVHERAAEVLADYEYVPPRTLPLDYSPLY